MRRYEVYSDASFDSRRKFGTYAFVVIYRGKIHAQGVSHIFCENTFQAEIAGLYAALDTIPEGSTVTANSDIRAIESVLGKGLDSKHLCVRKLTRLVRKSQLKVATRFEKRKSNRSEWYHLCHQRSRLYLRALLSRGSKAE